METRLPGIARAHRGRHCSAKHAGDVCVCARAPIKYNEKLRVFVARKSQRARLISRALIRIRAGGVAAADEIAPAESRREYGSDKKALRGVLIQSADYIGSAAHFSAFSFFAGPLHALVAVNSCVPRVARARARFPHVYSHRLSRFHFSLFPRLSFFGANIMNIDKPSLLLYFSIYPLLFHPLFLSRSLFFQRWRVRRTREAETNRMRRRDEGRGGVAGTLHPFAVPAPLGTIALGTMRPRCTSPSPFPSARTLILSICLSFSDSMQSSCFGNILVRIRGTAESEAIRRPPRPFSPFRPSRSLDAIFTCGGGEEITVKAREFAFVEISRIPADTTPLFPRPTYPPFLSLFRAPSGFRHNLYIFEAESLTGI